MSEWDNQRIDSYCDKFKIWKLRFRYSLFTNSPYREYHMLIAIATKHYGIRVDVSV
jgi:hypothetical protein